MQTLRDKYPIDDERFDRHYRLLTHGDRILVTGGCHEGEKGTIGFFHSVKDTTNRPPYATVITDGGEKIVCSGNYLKDLANNLDEKQYNIQQAEDGITDTLSERITTLLQQHDDPQRSWNVFKRQTDERFIHQHNINKTKNNTKKKRPITSDNSGP